MMKKRLIVSFCFILSVAVAVFMRHEFEILHISQKPYLSNRQQFTGVFYTHFDDFEKVVKDLDGGENVQFQYNTNLGEEQIWSAFKDEQTSEDIVTIVRNSGMTNIQKNSHYCLIYQYAPISGSDIQIGVGYDYTKEKWEYYYKHEYDSCYHNKFIYRIYDCLYNNTRGWL